ncbi:MAG TPA: hypothetical protein VFD58_32970 [Blastocatellia bacterium]|nr:hypothetical protein [Blastocatellia bacterium]
MTDISFEKILEEAGRLPPEDQRRLIETLAAEAPPRKPLRGIEQLAAEQGVKPINFAELRKLGEFFPEDESVDDLVNFIRELGRGRHERRIE